MSAALTKTDAAFLKEPQIAAVATKNADGSIQLTPVWIDSDDEAVLFNTAKGRVKHRNLERDRELGILVIDSANPHRWLSVSGRAEFVDEGADDHIDRLAQKYLGAETYPFRTPDEVRVTVRLVPERRVSEGL